MDTLTIQVYCRHDRDEIPRLGITVDIPYIELRNQKRVQELRPPSDYRDHDYQNLDDVPIKVPNSTKDSSMNLNNLNHLNLEVAKSKQLKADRHNVESQHTNSIRSKHNSRFNTLGRLVARSKSLVLNSSAASSPNSNKSNGNINNDVKSNHNNNQSQDIYHQQKKQQLPTYPKQPASACPGSQFMQQGGLLITHIHKNGVIDKNGQFRIGDIIVEVNGINLQRRTFKGAQKKLKELVALQSSQGLLVLKVLRKRDSTPSLTSVPGLHSPPLENGNHQKIVSTPSPKSKSHKVPSPENSLSPAKATKSLDKLSPSKNSHQSDSTSPKSTSSSSAPRHLIGSLNTRRIGTKHHVRLAKGQQGFGIKIAERDNMFGSNRPIYITAITTTGSAYNNGQLKEGDMILEVICKNKSGKTQPEVTKMLKELPVNESVEFIVSRQEDNDTSSDRPTNGEDYINIEAADTVSSCEQNGGQLSNQDHEKSLIDLNVTDSKESVVDQLTNKKLEERIDNIFNLNTVVDGPGMHVYDIPTNDTRSAGLGLYLKYPSISGKDLGIYIEKVITGGAAWKDGRLQPGDQILAVNGVDLVNLSNDEASRVLNTVVWQGIGPEAQPDIIRLTIHRRDSQDTQQTTDPTPGVQSCDDDSIEPEDGEDQFQRGGFGRQSISEKRHAQLAAKNTDTFKRNQKLREERERQKQVEEQLARQHIHDQQNQPRVISQSESIHSASPNLQYPPRNISTASIPKVQPIYGTSMYNYQFNSMRATIPPKPEVVNHFPNQYQHQQANIPSDRFVYLPHGQPYINGLIAHNTTPLPNCQPPRPPRPVRQPEQSLNRSGMLDLAGRATNQNYSNGLWNNHWTGLGPNGYYGSTNTPDYNRNMPTYQYIHGHNLTTNNYQPLTAGQRMVHPQPTYINQAYSQSQPHQQPRVYYIYYV